MTKRSPTAARLEEVWPALKAGDPGAVHAARKLTRRAQAELRVAGAGGKVRRAWRDLRRAAAPLRDHDVAGSHLRAALVGLGAPPPLLDRFDAEWSARRAGLLAGTEWPQRPPSYDLKGGWKGRARKLAAGDVDDLIREGEAALASEDTAVWHEWRKNLKRYRYTLDLLGDVPTPLTDVLDALGRLQDTEVTTTLLRDDPALVGLLGEFRDQLLVREAAAGKAARAWVRTLFPAFAGALRAAGGKDKAGEKEGRVRPGGEPASAQA
ncbi:CHAD domain-containing protein [Deinococcus aetherius]|uniref:CHAD domain-containing protein n=1 Tax=Deinococcus aetherius TaxID=200252 RepID=A0ABN6RBH5_9DEIO|nr:CHAD domain-containing protein [Deinococcus aetherius]BDP40651.1 CHAD domain-containing protein [Deinococcus aetherius]